MTVDMTRTQRINRMFGALLIAIAAGAGACSKPSADEHFKKANGYAAESRWSEAVFEYRLAVQAAPTRGDIHTKLADAYVHTRDVASGAKEYVRAADLLPNDP